MKELALIIDYVLPMEHANMKDTIVALTSAVLETISEQPDGAPAGPLYLAFQHINIPLDTFTLYMASLERLGFIAKRFDCYHITDGGRKYLTKFTELSSVDSR